MNNKSIKTYGQKRAEAIREIAALRHRLLSKDCTVEVINRAYYLKKQFNL